MRPDLNAALAAENAAQVAQAIMALPDADLVELVHELRYRRHLNEAVHALNGLIDSKTDGDAARKAIRRLGLERSG